MANRMLFILFAGLMSSPAAFADVTTPGGKVIDCYCTDTQGSRVELGESICLFVGGRAFMARCEMSLNAPMWRDTGKGCVSAGNATPLPLPNSPAPNDLSRL